MEIEVYFLEKADQTWCLNIFVCEGLRDMHAHLLSRYHEPSLCRESRSAVLWMPNVRLQSVLPRRELLSRAVQFLLEDVVRGIVRTAQHLQQYGSFSRGSLIQLYYLL